MKVDAATWELLQSTHRKSLNSDRCRCLDFSLLQFAWIFTAGLYFFTENYFPGIFVVVFGFLSGGWIWFLAFFLFILVYGLSRPLSDGIFSLVYLSYGLLFRVFGFADGFIPFILVIQILPDGGVF